MVERKLLRSWATSAATSPIELRRSTDRAIGALTLERFNHTGKQITVDADVRGRLQAELRDPYDRPLEGFELNSCAPVVGDSQSHVLTWAGGKTSAEYRYDVVGLRIEIEDGVVYSVET